MSDQRAVVPYADQPSSGTQVPLQVDADGALVVTTSGASAGTPNQTVFTGAGLALAANASRKLLVIQNTSTAGHPALIGFGFDPTGGNATRALILASDTSQGQGGVYASDGSYDITSAVYVRGTSVQVVFLEG